MRTFLIVVTLASGLHAGEGFADLIDCEQIKSRWSRANDATPIDEWKALYDDAFNESDCGSRIYSEIGRDIIEKELPPIRRTFGASATEASLRSLRARLDALRAYGSHWEVSFLLGETARKLRDARGAFQAYRDALALVDDEEVMEVPPPRERIALLRDRLDETAVVVAQLSPSAMKLPVTRSGEPISQYSFATRGYKRKKALAPVQFVFAKDDMTDAGRTVFEDLLGTLTKQGSPDITVIGHTDPIGSKESNMQLSLKRAAAIRRELLNANYAGQVTTKGMGEEQPFRFDDPGLYSEEVRNQSHRRVEVVLHGN